MVGHLSRRMLAEAIGTMLLIVFGPGSVVAALLVGGGRLDYAGVGVIALSFAVIVAVVIYAFGSTSGAHINPAVTVSLAVGRRFPWREVPFYIAAQLAGAVVGGLLIVGIFGRRATELGGVGLTALAPGVGYGQGILVEALGTFLLLLTIMALAVDRRAPQGWAGLMIGLAVAGEVFVLGPLTGGAINPARTFGPYVANDLFGGDTPWWQSGVYVIGPVVGGAVAVVLYDLVTRPVGEVPATAEQGTAGEITGESLPRPRTERPGAEPAAGPAGRPPGDVRPGSSGGAIHPARGGDHTNT
ncbi:glycerol uptake facilitator protein [Streptosporangium becharense]|uniref:Glycerol uptake facilitator protein n=1 Tax=Streptosporangium becharense TaxID=1816182 RepID=A0A7W9MJN2_9ACTN|nr:MIP/aquaporin family protein [Streptosporangium becharense]MBB2910512.1 glycerol uptake facilitator protein [Streptosporangium becharense]MBB5823255.1 glycerol uptake facilitator protein [Streptosporangium becharense]